MTRKHKTSVERIRDEFLKIEKLLHNVQGKMPDHVNYEAQRHIEKAAALMEMCRDRIKRAIDALHNHEEG